MQTKPRKKKKLYVPIKTSFKRLIKIETTFIAVITF